MPFKLNPQTLEPENGDFIAFLKEIEKGGTRVQGLKVTMSQDNPGMVTVTRTDVPSPSDASPGASSESLNALFEGVLAMAGAMAALAGAGLMVAGMSGFIEQKLHSGGNVRGLRRTRGGSDQRQKGSKEKTHPLMALGALGALSYNAEPLLGPSHGPTFPLLREIRHENRTQGSGRARP